MKRSCEACSRGSLDLLEVRTTREDAQLGSCRAVQLHLKSNSVVWESEHEVVHHICSHWDS